MLLRLNDLDALHRVEEHVRRFVDRELLLLVRQSHGWQQASITTGEIHLATNRILIELYAPDLGEDSLWLAFEERAGWLLADIRLSGWLSKLSQVQERTLANALAGFYKMAGVDLSALECGAHWPYQENAARDLVRADQAPSALHNNCSGKHSGMVCLACGSGVDPRGYIAREHFVQRRIAGVLAEVTGAPTDASAPCGIDGCSIPSFAFPLRALALGFARFGTGRGMSADRAQDLNILISELFPSGL